MVVDFIQTKSCFNENTYEYIHNNNVIYTAYFDRRLKEGLTFILQRNGQDIITLSGKNVKLFHNLFKSEINSKNNLYHVYDINEQNIGEIYGSYEKTESFYYKCKVFNFKNIVYKCYRVCLGKKGDFVCIYEGGNQIALIDKEIVVHNNNDKYKLYILDEKYLFVTAIFALYYDCITHGNYGNNAYNSKKTSIFVTTGKKLKEKYDPQFKDLC
ncbi:MAG: hypothetical protein ABF289_13435 [Clostridiales bacterium]